MCLIKVTAPKFKNETGLNKNNIDLRLSVHSDYIAFNDVYFGFPLSPQPRVLFLKLRSEYLIPRVFPVMF